MRSPRALPAPLTSQTRRESPPPKRQRTSSPPSRPFIPLCQHSTRALCPVPACPKVHFIKALRPHTLERYYCTAVASPSRANTTVVSATARTSTLATAWRAVDTCTGRSRIRGRGMGGARSERRCRCVAELCEESGADTSWDRVLTVRAWSGIRWRCVERQRREEGGADAGQRRVRTCCRRSGSTSTCALRTLAYSASLRSSLRILPGLSIKRCVATSSHASSADSRTSQLPYGTLTDDEMMRMPVGSMQDEGGLLFLWVTGRAMELGRECLAAWGYVLPSSCATRRA